MDGRRDETLDSVAPPPSLPASEDSGQGSDPGTEAGRTDAAPDSTVQVVCAIPARWASQRLPGKPLRELAGRPMIRHVVERVRRAQGIHRVVVLTDDRRIAAAVEDFGGEVEMTPEDCASGTDRIAWAARSWDDGTGVRRAVINVQGDEPLIEPEVVERVARHLADHPEDPMATLAAPMDPRDLDDPSKVKVVCDRDHYALYFSRAPIPWARVEPPAVRPRLHVGLYGYRLDALLQLAALPPSPLERTESLEQLRALENGLRIRVLPCEAGAFGIDTEADLDRAEELLAAEDAT